MITSFWIIWLNAIDRDAAYLQAQTVSSIIEQDQYDICVCDQSCEFVEMAFVKSGGEWWQNDFKSMIHAKAFTSDTITFKLMKDGVLVTTFNSNAYGDYYDFGSAFPDQSELQRHEGRLASGATGFWIWHLQSGKGDCEPWNALYIYLA
jgi:hypothetical protein